MFGDRTVTYREAGARANPKRFRTFWDAIATGSAPEVRHGGGVAILVALAPLVAGLWAYATGMSIGYAVAGILGAAFLYLIMRSYVELVRVSVDMLLPK